MLCQDFLGKCLFLHHHGMPDTEHVCAVRYAGYETFPCQTSNLSEINMPTSFATIFCLVVFFWFSFSPSGSLPSKKVVALLTSRLWEALGAVATSKPNLPTNWLGRLLLVTPQGALASNSLKRGSFPSTLVWLDIFLPRGWPRIRIAAWLNKATHPEMRAACSDASEVGQKRLTNPQVFSLQRRFGNATLVGELQGIQGDDMQFFHVWLHTFLTSCSLLTKVSHSRTDRSRMCTRGGQIQVCAFRARLISGSRGGRPGFPREFCCGDGCRF